MCTSCPGWQNFEEGRTTRKRREAIFTHIVRVPSGTTSSTCTSMPSVGTLDSGIPAILCDWFLDPISSVLDARLDFEGTRSDSLVLAPAPIVDLYLTINLFALYRKFVSLHGDILLCNKGRCMHQFRFESHLSSSRSYTQTKGTGFRA